MRKYNKIFVLILVVCVFISMMIIYDFSNNQNDYSRAIYSVILHNCTKEYIDNIKISYGKDINNPDSVVIYQNVNNIKPNEYRKVNIPTTIPSPNAQIPYNVWVSIENENGFTNYEAGYFGVETGGVALFEVIIKDDILKAKRVYPHEKKFKKIYKRHKNNQNELTW